MNFVFNPFFVFSGKTNWQLPIKSVYIIRNIACWCLKYNCETFWFYFRVHKDNFIYAWMYYLMIWWKSLAKMSGWNSWHWHLRLVRHAYFPSGLWWYSNNSLQNNPRYSAVLVSVAVFTWTSVGGPPPDRTPASGWLNVYLYLASLWSIIKKNSADCRCLLECLLISLGQPAEVKGHVFPYLYMFVCMFLLLFFLIFCVGAQRLFSLLG